MHIAAWTCGDGACALHSVWGVAAKRGESLYCAGAREHLLSCTPSDAHTACGLFDGFLREPLLTLLDDVWKDLALPAARAAEASGSVTACTAEVQSLWARLPAHIRVDLRHFVAQQSSERWQSERRIMPELQCFAREVFRNENEARVVRRLCIALGYLKLPDDSYNVLEASPTDAEVDCYEGDVGALQLLHPCIEMPGLTKYQALFQPSPMSERYRAAFFSQHGAQRKRRPTGLHAGSARQRRR